jgi:hypothetical protein
LWEHRIHQSLAHAVLAYQIESGTIDHLEIEIPSGLLVRGVNLIADLQTPAAPRMAGWKLVATGTAQLLTIHLQRPSSGTFHVLLELPWHRTSEVSPVPLIAPRPRNARVAGGFVAFLPDGLSDQPTRSTVPVLPGQLDFARAWLPSLASIPASSISSLPAAGESPIEVKLAAAPRTCTVHQRMLMNLREKEVDSQLNVQVGAVDEDLVYLRARLDPRVVIGSLQGPQVLRWNQSRLRPEEPTQLEVWLRKPLLRGQSLDLTIHFRLPLSLAASPKVTLLIPRVMWQAKPPPAMEFALSAGSEISTRELVMSPGIASVLGPHPSASTIGEFLVNTTEPGERSISLLASAEGTLPVVSSTVEPAREGTTWKISLQAAPGRSLPPHLVFFAKNLGLEQTWTVQTDAPYSKRASRGDGEELTWSFQAAAPWTRLQLTTVINHDGRLQKVPELSLPQLNNLKVPFKVSRMP